MTSLDDRERYVDRIFGAGAGARHARFLDPIENDALRDDRLGAASLAAWFPDAPAREGVGAAAETAARPEQAPSASEARVEGRSVDRLPGEDRVHAPPFDSLDDSLAQSERLRGHGERAMRDAADAEAAR